MLLSDRILEANEQVLGQMLHHRFVTDIKSGTLPEGVFHRYLAYEGAFVETAISIFAHAVARAPDMRARRWLIGVLDALANQQVPYFEDVFARLRITPPNTLPPEASAFDAGMLALARDGDFLDIVTAMFAAEWMYWTWCRDAATAPIENADLRAWVDLHADQAFADQALWLKGAIDTYGSPKDAARLSALFERVTLLEIDFHTAPYRAPNDAAARTGATR